MAKLTLNRPDDERLIISIDGEQLGSFSHDTHGWKGLEAAESLAVALAKKLGLEIDEVFDEDEG